MSSSSSPTTEAVAPNTARPRQAPQGSTKATHSPGDRISSILEGARGRKDGMATSPGNNGARGGVGSEEVESSADEETSIVRRGARAGMSYRAMEGAGTKRTGAGRRSRGEERDEDVHEEVGGQETESWWARMLSEYGSIELENKGSTARDHLALERTFLAWLRTSLAFASIGIAITQLFRLNTTSAHNGAGDPYKHLRQMGKPLGATFLGISIVMLFVGFHRYFEGQHWIIRGKFPASRGSIALVAAVTFALMVTSLVVVVVVEPASYEKR